VWPILIPASIFFLFNSKGCRGFLFGAQLRWQQWMPVV